LIGRSHRIANGYLADPYPRKGRPGFSAVELQGEFSVFHNLLFFGTKDRVVGESRFTKVDPSLLLIFNFKVSAQKNESIPLLPFREFDKTVRTSSTPKLD
jgi:hypothetical protein